MLKEEFKRLISSKFFYFAIILGVLMGILGLSSYYEDTAYFRDTNNGNAISSYEAWFYCLALGGTAIYKIFVPLLASLPFCDSYIKDRKCGYINYVLIRTNFKTYFKNKLLINALAGGLAASIPLILLFLISNILFPANIPNTRFNYYPSGAFSQIYKQIPAIYIFIIILMNFLFGALYSTIGLGFSVLLKNRLAVTAIPFFLYLFLIVVTQMGQIKFLFPLTLVAPFDVIDTTPFMIFSGFVFTFSFVFVLVSTLYKKDSGDVL